MLDERQPHLHRLFHHICHIACLQFAHQVVAVKFYGIVADVQLPGDGIGGMSLGYVLQDFEFSIREIDLLDILLIDQSEKLLTIIPLSFFYLCRAVRSSCGSSPFKTMASTSSSISWRIVQISSCIV